MLQCGYLRTLLTWQKCIQNIPKRSQVKQIASKVLRGCFSDKKYVFENIRVFNFTKWLNLRKEVKSWIKPKYQIWKNSFIQNFHQQEKFWNHLLDPTLRKTGQKPFHQIYLFCPGWKNVHIKAGQNRPVSFFIPFPFPFSYKQLLKIWRDHDNDDDELYLWNRWPAKMHKALFSFGFIARDLHHREHLLYCNQEPASSLSSGFIEK